MTLATLLSTASSSRHLIFLTAIRQLIAASVESTQRGSRQVEQAGMTMQVAQQQQRQTGELKTAISIFRLV
ncbi:hypothetical protein [Scandinavium manionii]|uniref:hypothetical protein n=1 Tax=Scandinavium manionii TaxID=2926520 RepID=UPI00135A504B|nr:hypothetical protein [Scandinavium manionii]MCS2148382.1 hypothetical protein [Scandinavium manionii]